MYKIRNKTTGLFYSQLNNNFWDIINTTKWNKTGKTWNRLQDLQKLIKRLKQNKRFDEYKFLTEECEIVEFVAIEHQTIEFKDAEKTTK